MCVSERDHTLCLEACGLNDNSEKAILGDDGLEYGEFVAKAHGIDRALVKDEEEKLMTSSTRVNNDGKEGSTKMQSLSQPFRSSSPYCSLG